MEFEWIWFSRYRYIRETENIALDVADKRVNKDLLLEIVTSLLYEDDYSEELNVKIIHAKTLIQVVMTIRERRGV